MGGGGGDHLHWFGYVCMHEIGWDGMGWDGSDARFGGVGEGRNMHVCVTKTFFD